MLRGVFGYADYDGVVHFAVRCIENAQCEIISDFGPLDRNSGSGSFWVPVPVFDSGKKSVPEPEPK